MSGVAAIGNIGQPIAAAFIAFFLVTLSIAIVIISVLVFGWPEKRFRPGNKARNHFC